MKASERRSRKSKEMAGRKPKRPTTCAPEHAAPLLREVDARAIETFKARQKEHPHMEEVGLATLGPDGPDIAHAANALMTGDPALAFGICSQLQHIAHAGHPMAIDRMNFMLSIINGIAPRDPTEALLASQMGAIHCAFMECARRMKAATTTDRVDAELYAINRLSRTFSAQMETLKRCRSKGEQSIKVQHVNVNAGQAVVGINQGGEGTKTNLASNIRQLLVKNDGSVRSRSDRLLRGDTHREQSGSGRKQKCSLLHGASPSLSWYKRRARERHGEGSF